MKKITPILLTVLFTATVLLAGKVPLSWDDTGNPPGTVVMYRLYATQGTNDSEGSFVVTNRLKLAEVPYTGTRTNIRHDINVPGGTYRVVATAVNSAGLESDDSGPVHFEMPFRPDEVKIAVDVTIPGSP